MLLNHTHRNRTVTLPTKPSTPVLRPQPVHRRIRGNRVDGTDNLVESIFLGGTGDGVRSLSTSLVSVSLYVNVGPGDRTLRDYRNVALTRSTKRESGNQKSRHVTHRTYITVGRVEGTLRCPIRSVPGSLVNSRRVGTVSIRSGTHSP